jgi:hypothetical protein
MTWLEAFHRSLFILGIRIGPRFMMYLLLVDTQEKTSS